MQPNTTSSMSPKTKQPQKRPQIAPDGAPKHKRKRKLSPSEPKRSSWRTKSKREAGSGERPEEESRAQLDLRGYAESGLLPDSCRVPFKSVLEAEDILVFSSEGGRDRAGARRRRKPSASFSSSQLEPHQTETPGPAPGPHLDSLPPLDRWLRAALEDADLCYRRRKYAIAASRFAAAMELCSKGAVLGSAHDADYEDISKVTSFIQSRLVTCYLRMRKPDLALVHSHRSIFLNPIHYRNHIQQAMVYRLLGRPCEAARSALVADYMYWLSGGSDERVSGLIKDYWQAMLEQAIAQEERFAVAFSPSAGPPAEEGIGKMMEIFRKQRPAFARYLFTDQSGDHLLPQTTTWAGPPSQRYTLTLGFKNSEDGNFLEKLLTRKYPVFTGSRAPFAPLSVDDLRRMTNCLHTRILPVLDFLKCTRLTVGISAGSGVLERLQLSDYLGRLRRTTEQNLLLQQSLAELAVVPYLQDLSPEDSELLKTLMADCLDTLAGGGADQDRVWEEIHKVGLLEELVYEQEQLFHRNQLHKRQQEGRKRPKADRKPRSRKKKLPGPPTTCTPPTQPPTPDTPQGGGTGLLTTALLIQDLSEETER